MRKWQIQEQAPLWPSRGNSSRYCKKWAINCERSVNNAIVGREHWPDFMNVLVTYLLVLKYSQVLILSVLWDREGKKERREGGRKKQRKEEGFNPVCIINALTFWIRNQETTIIHLRHIFFNHIMFPFFSNVIFLRYSSNVTEKELRNIHKGKIVCSSLHWKMFIIKLKWHWEG